MSQVSKSRCALVPLFLIGLFGLFGGTADAHVIVTPENVYPGFTDLTFRVLHGCGDAPTTRVTVTVPEEFVLAKPVVITGWNNTAKSAVYAEPVDLHGEVFTEGLVEMSWEGGSLPADYIGDFTVALMAPEQSGETFRFFVVQECEGLPNNPQEWNLEVDVIGGFSLASVLRNMPLILGSLALIIATIALVFTIAKKL